MSIRDIVKNWMEQGESLQVPNVNTRIWREGSGEPVVCLHGVPASGFVYRKVIPALAAKGFDVIRRIPNRIRSLTVLNTFLYVVSLRRPLVMEPFAHRGIGWLWLQAIRTPMIIPLMRRIGTHNKPTNSELRAYGALLVRKDGGQAFLKIMRSFERTQEFETGIITALQNRTFPVQMIWGVEDPVLKMETYAPPIAKILRLKEWHQVYGKHFLQEDSPVEIAQHVATTVLGQN